MELDSLKELWKEAGRQQAAPPGSDEQVLAMLQKKSQSPISKMKRNLRWELVVLTVLYSLTIAYYLLAWEGRYWVIALMLGLILAFFAVYYYHKNKLLSNMECVTCEVRSNLSMQLKTLEKYVRFYFISGTLLTPIAYFMAGLVVLLQPSRHARLSDYSSTFYLTFIGVGIIITVAIYFLNIWYVYRLYGQHIKRLKNLLRDMDEGELAN